MARPPKNKAVAPAPVVQQQVAPAPVPLAQRQIDAEQFIRVRDSVSPCSLFLLHITFLASQKYLPSRLIARRCTRGLHVNLQLNLPSRRTAVCSPRGYHASAISASCSIQFPMKQGALHGLEPYGQSSGMQTSVSRNSICDSERSHPIPILCVFVDAGSRRWLPSFDSFELNQAWSYGHTRVSPSTSTIITIIIHILLLLRLSLSLCFVVRLATTIEDR